jgi:hypothetical protein
MHLTGGAVGGLDAHGPRGQEAEVLGLARVTADDGLDVLRPAPSGLERVATDLAAGELHHLDGGGRVRRADLVG